VVSNLRPAVCADIIYGLVSPPSIAAVLPSSHSSYRRPRVIRSARKSAADRISGPYAMRAAAKELDAMIASWGASEDDLLQEYKEIRRAGREKKRNAR
jgi:hypothetical protein